jgi:Ca-activated chloride channel homolog
MTSRSIAAAAAALFLCGAGVRAQVFRSGALGVRVDVSVTDGRNPVGGLQPADFELRDAGVLQRIESARIEDVPLSVLLALDVSQSVEGERLAALKDAARAAVAALKPDDRASLIVFNYAVRQLTPWGATNAQLTSAIAALDGVGGTSLFDAAFAALTRHDAEPGRRRLLIVFTDGDDTTSWLPQDVVLEAAGRTDTVIYAVEAPHVTHLVTLGRRSGVRLTPDQPVLSKTEFLKELTARGGGERLTSTSRTLPVTFAKIISDFRTRYVLTYTPAGVDGRSWHPIEVRVKGRSARVTARRGYTVVK